MRIIVTALAIAVSLAAMPLPASGQDGRDQGSFRLRTYPEKIYFSTSNSRLNWSASSFFLILEDSSKQPIVLESLDLRYLRGEVVVRDERILGPQLDAITVSNLPPGRLLSSEEATKVQWPHSIRLFLSVPSGANADRVSARLSFSVNGKKEVVSTILPVQTYSQKTALIFPFKGKGIVTQSGVIESGHRNRSGLYAVDALGLNPTYGPMVQPERDEDPKNYAGWGREIIAPAAGTIIVARNDGVDQPVADKSDPAYYLPKYPDGGDPGNLVVIDHGTGEFSMIAHMQRNSVRVKVGDRVAQGQVLGLMGNSGDSTGPHVHYQLQNGPDWERSDALPFKFSNVRSITRGSFFEAT